MYSLCKPTAPDSAYLGLDNYQVRGRGPAEPLHTGEKPDAMMNPFPLRVLALELGAEIW